MMEYEKEAVARLIQSNSSHLFLLCNDFASVSDSRLEELIGSHIQDNLRIIQKLKAIL